MPNRLSRLNRSRFSLIRALLVPALALLAAPGDATAEAYPSNACASEKLASAADRCDTALKAWSIWDQNQHASQRDKLLAHASEKFQGDWAAAESAAASQGVDCADMTLSAPDMEDLIDAGVAAVVADVNAGLDLSHKKDAICGSRLLDLASTKCRNFLRAESDFIADLAGDPEGAERDAEQAKASEQFGHGFAQATRRECPTDATAEGVEARIDTLSADVLAAITVSPNVPDDAFMAITHPAVGDPGHEVAYEGDVLGPRCQDSSQYSFFARRGSENKLLVYYQGGGACWSSLTCGVPLCTQDVNVAGFLAASQNGFGGGFGDLTNPANPFRNWNIVFVPYCTCDVHWGDAAVDYPPAVIIPNLLEFPAKHVEHRGYDNAKLAEKWAREHFVNPSDVFVTGSSAGAYGATMGAIPLNEVYPASNVSMLADAGNGVITQDFVEQNFGNWGVDVNLPDIPGIGDVAIEDQRIPSIIEAAAAYYPEANWAHYTTAFDGGTGGQTGFYNVMLNPNNFFVWLNWWNASCAFNSVMRDQSIATAAAVAQANDNYRYYIASGSAHTGFGQNRVYTDTTGGVPTLVSWINAMIDDTPAWTNVEASPSNVLFNGQCSAGSDTPGAPCGFDSQCVHGTCVGEDPRPVPLKPPFAMSGMSTVVNCGP